MTILGKYFGKNWKKSKKSGEIGLTWREKYVIIEMLKGRETVAIAKVSEVVL